MIKRQSRMIDKTKEELERHQRRNWGLETVEKIERQEEKEMNTPISKDLLNRIEHLEELAGVKKEPEQWPKIGDTYYFIDSNYGPNSWTREENDSTEWRIKNMLLFKTKESCEKYYSIIDTINNIVDELGRPTLEGFEDRNTPLHTVFYSPSEAIFHDRYWNVEYETVGIFPYCKKPYLERLLSDLDRDEEALLWAFKKSMRLA